MLSMNLWFALTYYKSNCVIAGIEKAIFLLKFKCNKRFKN